MKKLLATGAIAVVALAGCASISDEAQAANECEKSLRYEIEQNVDGTTEQWLAYDMAVRTEAQKQEPYEGGTSYTFGGTATLTADNFPTKSVEFTCFVNRSDGGDTVASIHTINGKCTVAREEMGACD